MIFFHSRLNHIIQPFSKRKKNLIMTTLMMTSSAVSLPTGNVCGAALGMVAKVIGQSASLVARKAFKFANQQQQKYAAATSKAGQKCKSLFPTTPPTVTISASATTTNPSSNDNNKTKTCNKCCKKRK